MHCKGQAGSMVFRGSALLPNSLINPNWLLKTPFAPECGCSASKINVDEWRNASYHEIMIKSFKCKDTEKLFNDIGVKRFRSISRTARIKLEVLNAAISLQSLRVPPGNRLEQLKGNRKGQHCIRINDQWRICFVWSEENVFDVEIVDYHKG